MSRESHPHQRQAGRATPPLSRRHSVREHPARPQPTEAVMTTVARTRRPLLIAIPLGVFLLIAVAELLILASGEGLKSRSTQIPVGMPREEVEGVLGPP